MIFILLNKQPCSWWDLAPRRMPIFYPVRSAVYTGRSLPDTWHTERQLYWHPERSHPAETGFWSTGIGAQETLASDTPMLSDQKISIGFALNGLHYCSNIRWPTETNLHPARSKDSTSWGVILISKLKSFKNHRNERDNRKIKNQ
jgi:hypothetical protein